MSRLVCGVGVNDMHWGSRSTWTKRQKKVYQTWRDMLRRCYDPKTWVTHPTYQNSSVCDSWKYLSNFNRDVNSLPNYDKWLSATKLMEYCLNKEHFHSGNKIYCPEECGFDTNEDNLREMQIRTNKRTVKQARDSFTHYVEWEDPLGNKGKTFGATEASVQTGCSAQTIRDVAKAKWGNHIVQRGKYKGWRFEYV